VVSITKRKRRRRTRSGAEITHTRFVVNFRDPHTGRRKQYFFERHQDAVLKREAILSGSVAHPFTDETTGLTIAQAVAYWLEARRSDVKSATWQNYHQLASYIVGPILLGTAYQRRAYTMSGQKPQGAEFLDMLGAKQISGLSTADIRRWHQDLAAHVSSYTAKVAKKFLRAALVMVAEDFNLRIPPMPSRVGRGRARPRKTILSPDQVGLLLGAALKDDRKGLYYAFPFLTGVRPSEQFALLWEDVDLASGVIRVRRMQEQDGTLAELTKTAAGTRDIPLSPLLKEMLGRWKEVCPRASGSQDRLFPALGNAHDPRGREWRAGRPLTYANFRASYWRPALKRLGLPYVTPHSARHAFISTLQAQGIEVGLVAKLAGHANATVTLAHYTQAVRGGEGAVEALERAYRRRLQASVCDRTGNPADVWLPKEDPDESLRRTVVGNRGTVEVSK
jgi:integrase